jgi:hypothetical protein
MSNKDDINKNSLLSHYQNVLALLLKHVNHYWGVACDIIYIELHLGLFEFRTLIDESRYLSNSIIYLW